MSSDLTVPQEWTSFTDDAAVFPPGDADLADAVTAWLDRRESAGWAPLVGPLVVGDRALPGLADLVPPDAEPLPVTVVVSGGAGGLAPLPRWFASGRVRLAGIEVALRDLDDLPGNARRVVAAAQQASYDLPDEVPVHVELPQLGVAATPEEPSPGWLAAADEIAMGDLRGKLRTGGVEADLFPTEAGLAAAIEALLDRELAFKCTAGLHRAVRHRAGPTGFEHHGFLNVLLATRASLDGESAGAALAERDAEVVAERVRGLGADGVARTRRWFTSFGCCGVEDPWHDLVSLGLA
ncbi:hypothetical protein [Nocardioides marmoribigeumensis]|uniref:Uncharacterized protein n=1 Tax=Nocardioides marmoribigeumensis TaxID=433649 RepID=A0ABU2C0I4_9ACTN|nr:hypothetical protein [Nocardioides marmoribigeumensis]MDR7364119.1 hypothetical protein [Nocardioides marmoribigeumensis]